MMRGKIYLDISCTQLVSFRKSKGHKPHGTRCMLGDIASIVSVNDTTRYGRQTHTSDPSENETQPHSHA